MPLDTELERKLKNLKKVKFAETVVMAEQREIQQQIPAEEVDIPQGQRTMEDFWKPIIKMIIQQSSNLQLKQTTLSLSLH